MTRRTSSDPKAFKILKAEILAGSKHPDERRIGVEWEKIGVRGSDGHAIRYAGTGGVAQLFRALCARHGWSVDQRDDDHVVALRKGFTRITLEPGGQIELSGGPAYCLRENARELDEHLREVREVSAPHDILWLGLGCQPFSPTSAIDWVPKRRYAIMRRILRNEGERTYSMMKRTASIQASFDFTSEADAADKFRLATLLSPFLTAIFANSPFSEGRVSPYLSYRTHIWRGTDPHRSGVLTHALRRDFTIDDYVRYALDVPMFFVQRASRLIPVRGLSFRRFLQEGYRGLTAGQEDWRLHLSTIFTDARLKTYVEIRSIDCLPPDLSLSAPTLLKGLFYCPSSLRAALRLLEGIKAEDFRALYDLVPRTGLETPVGRHRAQDYAEDLLRYSERGLRGLAESRCCDPNDRQYLEPLKELVLKRRLNPAQRLLQCWRSRTRRDLLGLLRRETAF